jgi:uncharacterized membrane protein (UPF0127 family)
MRRYIVPAVMAGLILGFVWMAGPTQIGSQEGNGSRVCISDSCFYVELALTPQEQARGLMYRESLDRDSGMLFVLEGEGIYPFWMKNALIPLDIIWIDGNMTVVFISRDAQPCGPLYCPSINPGVPARYVLEINGGLSDELGFVDGDMAVMYL